MVVVVVVVVLWYGATRLCCCCRYAQLWRSAIYSCLTAWGVCMPLKTNPCFKAQTLRVLMAICAMRQDGVQVYGAKVEPNITLHLINPQRAVCAYQDNAQLRTGD